MDNLTFFLFGLLVLVGSFSIISEFSGYEVYQTIQQYQYHEEINYVDCSVFECIDLGD